MFNAISALAVFVMIGYLYRNSKSYFKPFRSYFILIYLGFLAAPAQQITLVFFPDSITLLILTTQLFVTALLGIAVLWGHLATRLYLHPERFSIFNRPRSWRDPRLVFWVYLSPMIASLAAIWLTPLNANATALYILERVSHPVVAYESWHLGLLASVGIAFVVYPNIVLVHLRRQLKDREIRYALKIFIVCFAVIAWLFFSLNALAASGYSLVGLGHTVDMALLIIVARAFRRPSFLKAFLGLVPSLTSTPITVKGDRRVILYGGRNEKFAPFSRYIMEGVNSKQRVIYFHQGANSHVMEMLDQKEVNASLHILKGELRLIPFTSLYNLKGYFEEKDALRVVRELESESRLSGNEGLRVLIDYGDFAKPPQKRFVGHLASLEWTRQDRYLKVLMAFDKRAFNSQEAMESLTTQLPVLDLTEAVEAFSRALGLTHADIAGRKILFEYDPQSNTDTILKALVAEAGSNLENIILFTRRDSAVHSIAGNEPGLITFLLTANLSHPHVVGENRVELPVYDSSLILEAMNKTVETYPSTPFTIVFDNVTHMIFILGVERAHSLVRQALELLASHQITAVFLLNVEAHDQKTVSIFESLFDVKMSYGRGARAPEIQNEAKLYPHRS